MNKPITISYDGKTHILTKEQLKEKLDNDNLFEAVYHLFGGG